MDIDVLDNSNFILFAAKHYCNSQALDDEEFFSDLKRVKYLKRLFRKYEESGDLKERLVLNHLIVLSNVFGPTIMCRLLFFKLAGHYELLKPFLEFLGMLPETVDFGSPPKNLNTSEIVSNPIVFEKLSKI